jgi:hypothetical protein
MEHEATAAEQAKSKRSICHRQKIERWIKSRSTKTSWNNAALRIYHAGHEYFKPKNIRALLQTAAATGCKSVSLWVSQKTFDMDPDDLIYPLFYRNMFVLEDSTNDS